MARLDAPTPLVAIATAGLPVNLPSASAINEAPDSWRVETRERSGCSSAASRISRKLSPGTVYRRLTRARAITSAATYPAAFIPLSAIRPPNDPGPHLKQPVHPTPTPYEEVAEGFARTYSVPDEERRELWL